MNGFACLSVMQRVVSAVNGKLDVGQNMSNKWNKRKYESRIVRQWVVAVCQCLAWILLDCVTGLMGWWDIWLFLKSAIARSWAVFSSTPSPYTGNMGFAPNFLSGTGRPPKMQQFLSQAEDSRGLAQEIAATKLQQGRQKSYFDDTFAVLEKQGKRCAPCVKPLPPSFHQSRDRGGRCYFQCFLGR